MSYFCCDGDYVKHEHVWSETYDYCASFLTYYLSAEQKRLVTLELIEKKLEDCNISPLQFILESVRELDDFLLQKYKDIDESKSETIIDGVSLSCGDEHMYLSIFYQHYCEARVPKNLKYIDTPAKLFEKLTNAKKATEKLQDLMSEIDRELRAVVTVYDLLKIFPLEQDFIERLMKKKGDVPKMKEEEIETIKHHVEALMGKLDVNEINLLMEK
jgi:hypothetical protein